MAARRDYLLWRFLLTLQIYFELWTEEASGPGRFDSLCSARGARPQIGCCRDGLLYTRDRRTCRRDDTVVNVAIVLATLFIIPALILALILAVYGLVLFRFGRDAISLLPVLPKCRWRAFLWEPGQ